MQMNILRRLCIALVLVVVFSLGYVFGCHKCNSHHNVVDKNKQVVRFWAVKKRVGQTHTSAEKVAMNIFKVNLNKCLDGVLTHEEQLLLGEVKKSIIQQIGDSKYVEVPYDALGDGKKIDVLARKVKKCKKNAKMHMTKSDIRLMKYGVSKMKIVTLVDFFEGF